MVFPRFPVASWILTLHDESPELLCYSWVTIDCWSLKTVLRRALKPRISDGDLCCSRHKRGYLSAINEFEMKIITVCMQKKITPNRAKPSGVQERKILIRLSYSSVFCVLGRMMSHRQNWSVHARLDQLINWYSVSVRLHFQAFMMTKKCHSKAILMGYFRTSLGKPFGLKKTFSEFNMLRWNALLRLTD